MLVYGGAVFLFPYLLSFLDAESSRAFIFVALLILGLSLGMFLPPNGSLVMAQSPAEKCGIASSLMMTARNVGTVIGIAVFETVFAAWVQLEGLFDGAVQSAAYLTLGFHDAFLGGGLLPPGGDPLGGGEGPKLRDISQKPPEFE